MLRHLATLFLLSSSNLWAAADCVDCGNMITGFPTMSSVQEASCSDCNCYTRTHDEALSELLPERAALVKEKLKNEFIQVNQQTTKSLARLDAILKIQAGSSLKSCSLVDIKQRVSACDSAPTAKHLTDVFGVDSIDGYLASLGQSFGETEGSISGNSQSCLSSNEVEQINSNRIKLKISSLILQSMSADKEKLKIFLSSGKKLTDSENKEFPELVKVITQASVDPALAAIFRDQAVLKYIVNNIETISSNDGSILDFFTSQVYSQFPSVIEHTKAEMDDLCKSLTDSVVNLACAGDSLAFQQNSEVSKYAFEYTPADHSAGFDSMFVNDEGRDVLNTNYVNHIYWCAGKSCQNEKSPSVCAKVPDTKEIDQTLQFVTDGASVNRLLSRIAPTFDANSLCKLANCSGTQAQMNACYEGVKSELGDDADSILLSYSRVQNQPNATQTNGNQVAQGFSRSEFAANFLGTYSPTPIETASENTNRPEPVATQNENSSASTSNATSDRTPRRVVTADQAFQEFMNSRFDSIANSSSNFRPAVVSNNSPVVTSNNSSTTSRESATERQARQALNQASNTIEELRDGYRQSAFDRMQRLVDQAARNSRANNFVAASGFNNASTTNSNNNSRANSNAAGVSRAGPGGTGVEQAAVANTESAAVNGRNPASVSSAGAATNASGSSAAAARVITADDGVQTLNVKLNELPRITPSSVENFGVDTNKPFNIAVKVEQQTYIVQVRPAMLSGTRMLEPMLDQLTGQLRAEVLKSPLFAQYRQYLLGQLVSN